MTPLRGSPLAPPLGSWCLSSFFDNMNDSLWVLSIVLSHQATQQAFSHIHHGHAHHPTQGNNSDRSYIKIFLSKSKEILCQNASMMLVFWNLGFYIGFQGPFENQNLSCAGLGGTTIKKTFSCSQCKIRSSHQPVKFSLG